MTQPDDFKSAKHAFESRRADSLLTATRTKRFYWTDDAQPLNYDPASRPRRQQFAGSLMENGAFYLTRRAVLQTQRCRLGGSIAIHEMTGDSAVEIDEPEDWLVVERLLRQRGRASREQLARIRALVVDVDGTLTDGGMYYDASGEAQKKFNTRDAHGLHRVEQAGLHIAVVTAERSAAVDARMRKLNIRDYIPGQRDKRAALETLAAQWNCGVHEIAYVGDDLNDLPGLEIAGLACCPADAVEAVRARADYVTRVPGGAGAVREVCDLLLQPAAAETFRRRSSCARKGSAPPRSSQPCCGWLFSSTSTTTGWWRATSASSYCE